MKWRAVAAVSLRSLGANKLRTGLAALGILIGVGAVVALLALGSGAQRDVLERVASLGSNLIMVRPGLSRGPGAVRSTVHRDLTLEDAEALLRSVEGLKQLSPVVSGRAQVKYLNRNTNVPVMGVAPTYFAIRGYELAKGRLFGDGEVSARAAVAVLGPVTAEDLFGEGDPLGETVRLKSVNFTVIGVLEPKGDQGFFNPDDQAMIPYTTAMNRVFGLDHLGEIDVEAATSDVEALEGEIARVLRRRHRLKEGDEDDFSVRSQAEIIERVSEVTGTFTLLLGGIAAISLLVGGIGIMNIMYVTVAERTREIGIRKAVGARNRDILSQFLFEAVLLSGVGGLSGAVFGGALAVALGRLLGMTVVIEPPHVLLALSFSAGVGVFFGYYPAKRAAGLNPIEALRYE